MILLRRALTLPHIPLPLRIPVSQTHFMGRPIAWFRLALCLVCMFAIPVQARDAVAAPADAEDTWMSVLLGGRKIGSLHVERQRDGRTVTTIQTLTILLTRNGKSIPLANTIRSVETPDGRPLGFGARTTMSTMDSVVEGLRLPDGRFEVDLVVGGATQRETIDWPSDALLAEGQRLAMQAAQARPGSHYLLPAFDPASRQVIDAQVDVLGEELVSLPDGPERLSHQRQRLHQARGDQVMDLWLDREGRVRKGLVAMLGSSMEMVACSRACAEAPAQSVDMFRAAMVASPRPLTPNLRNNSLRYRVHVEGDAAQPLIDTDEQRITPLGHGDWQIDTGGPHAHGQPPPQPGDLAANAWLQSDAPLIRELTANAIGKAATPHQKMRRLYNFVGSYITQHGLDVGYASALEVANTRQGDCTEFAVLLAAMARAAGVPARVVTGMVYADRYGKASRVFLPHAWVQAWVGNRWQSYDAALRQFDSTHVALDSGDGDPWHFYGVTDLFGRLRIDSIKAAPEIFDAPIDNAPAPAPSTGISGNGAGPGGDGG
ncbi:hypothetical protein PCA_11340 [Rhodanobacter sp. PCA2]|nr:hypothetical protein [Rhodanobacter sp. PCA2]